MRAGHATFGYERPETLAQAVAILRRHGPRRRLLAGGTDLIIGLRERELHAALVVDLPSGSRAAPGHRDGGRLAVDQRRHRADRHRRDERGPRRTSRRWRQPRRPSARSRSATGPRWPATSATPRLPPTPRRRCSSTARRWSPAGPAAPGASRSTRFFLGPGETALRARGARHGDRAPGAGRPGRVRVRPADPAAGRRPGHRQRVPPSIDGTGVTRLGFGAVGPRPLLAVDDSGVLADPAADPAARAEPAGRPSR